MNAGRCIASAILLIALGSASSSAQEWPRFRGPNGTGLSDASIPARWETKDVRWKITLPGGGHSSPVVCRDRVFITCADDQTAERMILCLSAADGSVVWKRTFASHTFREHPDNSYAASTPALDAQRLYVCWNTPEEFTLTALNQQDGTDVWKADLGPFVSQHGGGNSPIVFDDMVALGNDQEGRESFLAAFDCKTGTPRWKVPRQSSSFSAATPCVFQPEGAPAQLVFTSRSQGMTGIEAATGRVLWGIPEAFDKRTIGSPVLAGGRVFATCGEGAAGDRLVAVNPGTDGQSAKIAFRIAEAVPYVPTPVVKGGLLFLWSDAGTVTCASAGTGKKLWQERVGGSYYGSPVCAADRLYCVSKKGEVVVLAASEKFELLARNPLGEKSHATPAIAGGRMYVRTYTHLFCIGGEAGKIDLPP